ncbi:MAG: hypothetical protein WD648_02970 [Planctomycetaceae bacterium]
MTSKLLQHGLVAVVVLATSQTAHAQWQSRFSRYSTYQPPAAASCNCEQDDARAAHSTPQVPYQYQPVSYSANRWDTRQWTPRGDYDRLRVSAMTDPYWSTPNRGWGNVAQAPYPANVHPYSPVLLGIETADSSLKPVPDPVFLDPPQFDSPNDWELVPSRHRHSRPKYERRIADREERWGRRACAPKEPWCDDDEEPFIEAPTAALVFQTITSSGRY